MPTYLLIATSAITLFIVPGLVILTVYRLDKGLNMIIYKITIPRGTVRWKVLDMYLRISAFWGTIGWIVVIVLAWIFPN